jgi:hypothetical protein
LRFLVTELVLIRRYLRDLKQMTGSLEFYFISADYNNRLHLTWIVWDTPLTFAVSCNDSALVELLVKDFNCDPMARRAFLPSFGKDSQDVFRTAVKHFHQKEKKKNEIERNLLIFFFPFFFFLIRFRLDQRLPTLVQS